MTNLCIQDYEHYAPIIIYNGSSEQNSAFNKALNEGLSKLSLPDYPATKIVIIPLSKEKVYTAGQFDSLAEQVKLDSRLQGLNSDTTDILCISSAFHLRRIQRLFNSKTASCPFSPNAKITLWGYAIGEIYGAFRSHRADEHDTKAKKIVKRFLLISTTTESSSIYSFKINSPKSIIFAK